MGKTLFDCQIYKNLFYFSILKFRLKLTRKLRLSSRKFSLFQFYFKKFKISFLRSQDEKNKGRGENYRSTLIH
jgi:hypothetical protein